MGGRKTELTIEEVRMMLRLRCTEAGGMAAFAHAHSFTRQYLSQVLNGKAPVSERVCQALGIRYAGERWVRK